MPTAFLLRKDIFFISVKKKHYQAGLVGRIMAEQGEDIRRASLIIRDINEIFFDYFYTYIVFEQKKRKKYLIFCTLRSRKSSQVHFIFYLFLKPLKFLYVSNDTLFYPCGDIGKPRN